jgi:transposase
VAKLFAVCKRSVERYWKAHRSTGSLAPKPRGGYRRSRLAGHDDKLRDWIKADVSLTLEQMRTRLKQELGIEVGVSALWHRLNRLNLSFKKNAARRRARSARA